MHTPVHAIGSKAALAAVVGRGMWLGRPLVGAVVFAAVAAGGSHIHLSRAGGRRAGSFCCRRDRAHCRGGLLGCENRADFMAFSRDAGEKSLFPVFTFGLQSKQVPESEFA